MFEPEGDGWSVRHADGSGLFIDLFGTMRVRAEGPTVARLRIDAPALSANIHGNVHGGFLLALVDQALFVGPSACGVQVLGGVTIDVSCQFLAPVSVGAPLDAVIEILRETGRMLFVRGLLEQAGVACLAFGGTVRKPGPPRGTG